MLDEWDPKTHKRQSSKYNKHLQIYLNITHQESLHIDIKIQLFVTN